MGIGLLSAAFPPDFDGIGDYTYWLANALAQSGTETSVWTSLGRQRAACQGVQVNPFFDPSKPQSIKELPALLAKGRSVDWLVVEYNPFGFGRWGYCPWLVSMLRHLKGSRQCRVAVMFHETQVSSRPFKLWIMRQWQNRQLRGLSRLADVIFVSTTRWESEIKEVSPKAVCHHLPVGSNLPYSRLSWEAARKNLRISSDTLVLGMFGSSHPSRMTDWMGAAVRGAASVQDELVVLYVGKDGRAFREVCAGVPFMDQGHCLPKPQRIGCERWTSSSLLSRMVFLLVGVLRLRAFNMASLSLRLGRIILTSCCERTLPQLSSLLLVTTGPHLLRESISGLLRNGSKEKDTARRWKHSSEGTLLGRLSRKIRWIFCDGHPCRVITFISYEGRYCHAISPPAWRSGG